MKLRIQFTDDMLATEPAESPVFTPVRTGASGLQIVLGDRLGLYETLAKLGPATVAQLAEATGLVESYVGDWLSGQVASGFVDYDESLGLFSMTPEQVAGFAKKRAYRCDDFEHAEPWAA